MTDSSEQITENFQYSPYGLLLSGDSSKTPFLFNGKYGVMTDSNGLYYMRARFYSPEIKRFVNQDILLGNVFEGQTLNRYAFVTGRPVSFVDPEGKFGFLAGIGIGLGVWAVTEILIPTLFPPNIENDSGEVIPSMLPDIISTVVITAKSCGNLFVRNTNSSLWKSRPPGIQVRKFGDWWVKRVNPESNLFMQWWGKLSIKEQAEALRKLGDMAVKYEVRHGKLFVRHVETLPDGFRLLNPTSRQAYFGGSKRLGTYLNDIQPRNMGRNGLIFDPAIDSMQKGIFLFGVPSSIGIGLYISYPE